MEITQHTQAGNVYLHPTACTRPAVVAAFQRRTGLQLIVSPAGIVRAIPMKGAA
ncbi:hypothetical protein [Pseudomonas japonica]|uniref:hypothetical protein n=1 Tax=Pseudomonas japonica TaxID=256466 RepID=UPI003A8842BD